MESNGVELMFSLISLALAVAFFVGLEIKIGGENESNFDRKLLGWRRHLVGFLLVMNAFVLLISFPYGLLGISLIVTVGYFLGR